MRMRVHSLLALVLGVCVTFTTAYGVAMGKYSSRIPNKNVNRNTNRNAFRNTIMNKSRNTIMSKNTNFNRERNSRVVKNAVNTNSASFKIMISIAAPLASSASDPSVKTQQQQKPQPQPLYLLPNGSTTPDHTLAAACHTTLTSRLYCGNTQTPIGAATDAVTSLLSGVRGSEEGNFGAGGKAMVHGGWGVGNDEKGSEEVEVIREGKGKANEDKKEGSGKKKDLWWKRKDMKEKARFVLREDESGNNGGTVWAAFGNEEKRGWEGVEVGLVAVFD